MSQDVSMCGGGALRLLSIAHRKPHTWTLTIPQVYKIEPEICIYTSSHAIGLITYTEK